MSCKGPVTKDERGQDLVEYALIAALIFVALILSVGAINIFG